MKTRWICTIALASFALAACPKKEAPKADEPAKADEAAKKDDKAAEPVKKAEPKADEANKDEPKAAAAATGEKFGTPQACFDAAKKAVSAKNYGGFVDTMAPDSRGQMAMGLMMALGFMTMANKDAKKDVDALMKKHEVPDQSKMKDMKGSPQEKMEKLAASFKDPKAFIADAMTMIDKMSAGKGKKKSMVEGELADIKIEGDKATATMKREKGDKPIAFVKVDGSWYMAPPMKGARRKMAK